MRYDEKDVKTFSLQMYQGQYPSHKENQTYPSFFAYKYPKAGEDNAKVSVWSFDIKSRQTRKLDVPLDADGYIPRIKTTNNADMILVYTMNRHQDVLNVYTVNPRSTVAQLLVREKGDKYVKEEAIANISVYNNSFLLPSDRDGYMHLYLYDMGGKQIRKIAMETTTSPKFTATTSKRATCFTKLPFLPRTTGRCL